ncbi:MAG: type I DNA topoisomerase [Candidatus Andersenbacteria bacterium CG10_big_fil_rev_8_21_14_0_10_54_11]|uniref:DNA topoisomerase 1 n=1 Tax=Candidatus Andersenbacteria bacterium CG10_big_fil_rev_8_21_14_0_10_54_11 TaxID=1974485 RepID=A0A2M6X027_9BACT|nr:MAG: type I DNA topoisomerase [Candidatus Andersenbacteria bacterium CG10_big_fil_rev_8_21_14_0_10_54_11]
MKLVIVESPAKAKTIQQYLGHGFTVKSSYGHVRDLPKSKIGVDIDDNFTPQYVVPDRAKKQVAALKKAAASAEEIYFATDEDREGEAIAWHLYALLKPKPDKAKRITFAEITKRAIQSAVAHPRPLDQHLVDAQQARRILDRLVGYELSPLLWKKVRRGLSAGRVQSVAVRLIVEREEERNAFTTREYWSIIARLVHNNRQFTAELYAKDGKKLDKFALASQDDAAVVRTAVTGQMWEVTNIAAKEKKRTPPPPFTTSTLQQTAGNSLGFSSKKTMMLAQQLYEGVELGAEGANGLITYMRTDSVNLADEALAAAKETIAKQFGSDYALATPRRYKTKSKSAQEAHEAIRPTDPGRTPDHVATHLSRDQLRLYRLIWQRTVASQMSEARLHTITADITAGDYTFRARGTRLLFDGFVRALGESAAFKENILPELKKGERPTMQRFDIEQHFTQPPARYSESTLVKALEENGIGRPSTYAPTIDTIQRREYVQKNDDKRFTPTEIGTLVTNLLKEHFPNIVDLKFTAAMEENLDQIAAGEKKWQPVIGSFYTPFHQTIKEKQISLSKKELTEEKTGEICPECGGELVIKLGRFGKFKACSKYPDCKFTDSIGEEKKLENENSGEVCPDCGKPLVLKRGRFGPFLGCSGYPDCKHIKKIEKGTGVTCPLCSKGEIIEKRSKRGRIFYACNRYPDCKNAYWSKPTGENCPDCGTLLVYGAKNTVRCSSKSCKFIQEVKTTE